MISIGLVVMWRDNDPSGGVSGQVKVVVFFSFRHKGISTQRTRWGGTRGGFSLLAARSD